MEKSMAYAGAWGLGYLLFCLTLSPYLMNGFWMDDCVSSSIAGMTARTGQTIWDFAWAGSAHWIKNDGRFFPLSWLTGSYTFYLLQSVEYYRFYQVTLVLVHVGLFVWLLFELCGSWRLAGCVAVVLPIFFQIREYHDPIGAYGGLCQLVGICSTGSALLLAKFCRSQRYWQLIASTLLYAAGVLTYELMLITLPLLLFVIPAQASIKKWIAALLPALLVTGLYLFIVVRVRQAAAGTYPGIAVSLDWKKAQVTFGRQLFAAVPFSYWTAIWYRNLNATTAIKQTLGSWTGWIVFVGSFMALKWLLLSKRLPRVETLRLGGGWRLLGVGLTLAICPAAMIALSKRYQDEIIWGIGYLPVYISYFGMALLAVLSLFLLRSGMKLLAVRHQTRLLRWIVIGAGALLATNRTVNIAVAKRLDAEYKQPRALVEAAAQAGVFHRMMNGDSLLLRSSSQWLTEGFFAQHTGRTIKPISLHQSGAGQVDEALNVNHDRVFLLDYRVFDETDHGWLLLARINPHGLDGSKLKRTKCKYPSFDYSVFAKSNHEIPVLQSRGIRLTPLELESTNLFRRLYAAIRPHRVYARSPVVRADVTPCPDRSGELETQSWK